MKPNVFVPRFKLFKLASEVVSYGMDLGEMPEGRVYWKYIYARFLSNSMKLQGRRVLDTLMKDLRLFPDAAAVTLAPFSAIVLHDAYYKALRIEEASLADVDIFQDALLEARALSRVTSEKEFYTEFLDRRFPVYREVVKKRHTEYMNRKNDRPKLGKIAKWNTVTASTTTLEYYKYILADPAPLIDPKWLKV